MSKQSNLLVAKFYRRLTEVIQRVAIFIKKKRGRRNP